MAFWITTRQSARMEEGSAEDDDDDDAMTISFTKTEEQQQISAVITGEGGKGKRRSRYGSSARWMDFGKNNSEEGAREG